MPARLSILLRFFTLTYKIFLAPFFSAPYLMNSSYGFEERRPHLECLVGTGSVVLPKPFIDTGLSQTGTAKPFNVPDFPA